ncbi:MAG TPA: hypothetical protein VHS58_03480 [Acetobacteraceae bacterium]|jgi:hypothetical protein|nr:hypothetical protein [Acetobacteraceae bacterium]
MKRVCVAAALAASGLAAIAPAAHADAIDGHWCREGGLTMMIDGPKIVTPAGTPTQGDYARHYFSYVIPSGEPNAGVTVQMRLLNEDTVQVRETPQSEGVIWHRCGMPVS